MLQVAEAAVAVVAAAAVATLSRAAVGMATALSANISAEAFAVQAIHARSCTRASMDLIFEIPKT